MNTRSDMPAIEQELRDATHAYADQFEPASDAWARLRARADEVTPRRSRRWIFGIGGLAIATTAAALAIVLPGDSNEAIDVDLPTATQPTTSAPTTPFAVEGTEELYAFGFAEANASGLARFVRTGEPGADDEWTVELDATFWPEDEYMFSAGERIGLRLSPGEADPDETGQVEICSTDAPGADGRITCTATFPASVLQGAVPFGSDWAVGLVEAGRDDGRISNPVVAPVDADFVAHFTSGDAWGTSYFSRERRRHGQAGSWTRDLRTRAGLRTRLREGHRLASIAPSCRSVCRPTKIRTARITWRKCVRSARRTIPSPGAAPEHSPQPAIPGRRSERARSRSLKVIPSTRSRR